VKDRDVARKMVYFVDRSTIGVCKHAQLRAARILGVVSDELPRKAAAPLRLRAAAPGGALGGPARRRGRVRHVQPPGGGLRALHLRQPDRHGLPWYVAITISPLPPSVSVTAQRSVLHLI
jgi:hypothetical protein